MTSCFFLWIYKPCQTMLNLGLYLNCTPYNCFLPQRKNRQLNTLLDFQKTGDGISKKTIKGFGFLSGRERAFARAGVRAELISRNRFELWSTEPSPWDKTKKAARRGDKNAECSELVRVRRVELLSQPWEGHIMAVIRHPRSFVMIICSVALQRSAQTVYERTCGCPIRSDFFLQLWFVEPPSRIELLTCALRMRCSTS